jgi:uridylate kinase
MKRVIVISLGGSLIIPNKVDKDLLEQFKKILLKHQKNYRFVVVCGGGSTARNYIKGLEAKGIRKKEYFQSLLGISTTRLNARFLTYFFGKDANKGIPHDMTEVKNLLKKNSIVFCGALRYAPDQTSDTTSAKLANYFGSPFINLTNVAGLYDKNPKKFRSAKFIPAISHKEFLKMANKLKFEPGQHFVLDQKAARIIKKYNIPTYILGPDLKNLDRLLRNKHFIGTIIDTTY